MSTYCMTITSKRQLTLPAELCRKLKINRGDRIAFSLDPEERSLVGQVIRNKEATNR